MKNPELEAKIKKWQFIQNKRFGTKSGTNHVNASTRYIQKQQMPPEHVRKIIKGKFSS